MNNSQEVGVYVHCRPKERIYREIEDKRRVEQNIAWKLSLPGGLKRLPGPGLSWFLAQGS